MSVREEPSPLRDSYPLPHATQHLVERLLQQGNKTTDQGQAEHGSVDDDASSRIVIVVAATAFATGSVFAGVLIGVLIVARAGEGALNLTTATLLARSELLEGVAGLVNIVGAGDVEGTTDVLERREADATVGVNADPPQMLLKQF